MLECPAVTGQLDLDVDALLGEVGLDFLDGVANFHLVLSLITYIIYHTCARSASHEMSLLAFVVAVACVVADVTHRAPTDRRVRT